MALASFAPATPVLGWSRVPAPAMVAGDFIPGLE